MWLFIIYKVGETDSEIKGESVVLWDKIGDNDPEELLLFGLSDRSRIAAGTGSGSLLRSRGHAGTASADPDRRGSLRVSG